jgi:hypothetical protein
MLIGVFLHLPAISKPPQYSMMTQESIVTKVVIGSKHRGGWNTHCCLRKLMHRRCDLCVLSQTTRDLNLNPVLTRMTARKPAFPMLAETELVNSSFVMHPGTPFDIYPLTLKGTDERTDTIMGVRDTGIRPGRYIYRYYIYALGYIY